MHGWLERGWYPKEVLLVIKLDIDKIVAYYLDIEVNKNFDWERTTQ